jgi:quinol monooxygenase YgiN
MITKRLFGAVIFVCCAIATAAAQENQYTVSAVDLDIVPSQLEAFLAAAKENASATSKEAGNIAYVVSQAGDDPNHLFLFEVYKDAASVQAHRASAHFRKYMSQTREMVTKRTSRSMKSVALFGAPK